MTHKHIISVQSNGMVAITCPSPHFMAAVTHGGTGQFPDTTDARQIDNMVASDFDPDFSSKYVHALMLGGETDASALGLIKDRHLQEHTDHITMDFSELPEDWFFRDAWRMSGSGIIVDLAEARLIFARKLIKDKADAVKALIEDIEVALLTGEPTDQLEAAHMALKSLDLHKVAGGMAAAKTPDALKALWPTSLGG